MNPKDLYTTIHQLLIDNPELRGSDKKLMWRIWELGGHVISPHYLIFQAFIRDDCTTPETIARCRRKIQERFPELQAGNNARKQRELKANMKGNHIFNSKVTKFCPNCGEVLKKAIKVNYLENNQATVKESLECPKGHYKVLT